MAINKNFVVKNGFEVATDLILANATNKRVGIGSTVPLYTLDVRGGIGATNTYTSGISTIINELRVGTGGTVFSVIAGPVGSGQSVGVGSASPAYLLDVRSPVSTGQTALYVYGDARITGDLVVDDLVFDDATVQDLRVQETLFVGADGGAGIATIKQLNVSGLTTTNELIAYGISTFRGYAQFIDNTSLYFGNGSDLNIYHDGSNSYIQEQGTGNLYVQSNGGSVNIRTNTTENAVVANQDGSVELYYDNAKKFETVSAGATVTGTLFTNQLNVSGVSTFNAGTYFKSSTYYDQNPVRAYFGNSSEMSIYSTGTYLGYSSNYIDADSGYLDIRNYRTTIRNPQVITQRDLAVFDSTTFNNEFVKLYYGGNEKFATIGAGVTVTGTTFTNQLSVSGIATANAYYGDGSNLTGNARNLTATIGLGTTGGLVGYGVSFIQFAGPGVSTVYYNGTTGIATVTITGGGTGSASIGIGSTPGDAFVGIITAGNLWYNTNLGRLFIYYQDLDSAQWVDAAPFNVGVITSLSNVSFVPGSASSPSMYFLGDPQTGFFSPGSGQFTIVSTGSSVLNINPSGINVTGIITSTSVSTGNINSSGVVTSTSVSTGNINSSGIITATDFNSLSDSRYKKNVTTVDSALSKVDQLRGVKFDWKESGLPSYGVIAQELEEVLPELVQGNDPKTVNYNGIIGVLIEAIKELKAEVEELKKDK